MHAFFRGFSYPIKGLRWLNHPHLRRHVIIPLLINTLLFGIAIWWGAERFGALTDAMANKLVQWLPDWLDWLAQGLYWLLWPLFAISVLLLTFYTFTLVANLIASPFNSLLAERVEDLVDPERSRPQALNLWKEITTAPLTELKKLVYFILWGVPLLLLFLIPGINMAAPLIWMVFTAWMLVLEYADYPLGNHQISFPDQRNLLRERRLLALGFGAASLGITMVPILNFLAMPASVIGATLLWMENLRPPAPPS